MALGSTWTSSPDFLYKGHILISFRKVMDTFVHKTQDSRAARKSGSWERAGTGGSKAGVGVEGELVGGGLQQSL